MAKEIEFAWAAGLIDGDGCVSIKKPSPGHRYRTPYVTVDNTDREIIDELLLLFGGTTVAKKRYADHHRDGWSWRLLGGQNNIVFLTNIYPYMRCAFKKERARMIIEEYPVLTPRNGYYTPEMEQAKVAWGERFLALGEGRGKRAKPKLESSGEVVANWS